MGDSFHGNEVVWQSLESLFLHQPDEEIENKFIAYCIEPRVINTFCPVTLLIFCQTDVRQEEKNSQTRKYCFDGETFSRKAQLRNE